MRCSIKKLVVAATTLSLLAGVGASAAMADRGDDRFMVICHKPGPNQKTMVIPKKAWDGNEHEAGHKGHGDRPGPCIPGDPGDPGDHDSLCEAVLDHLTDIVPDDVAALLDLAAVASVHDLVAALARLEVTAGIDLDAIIDETTDGVCDVLHLVLHIKHKVLGVAFFATGEVFDLAGHVKHRALGVVGFAAGAASEVVEEAIEEATDGVSVGLDVAVYGLFGASVDASAAAMVGLL